MIGERLKRARKAAGLSMAALAKKVGVSATMISQYEKDRSVPNSGTLIALADALNVRSEYFFRPISAKTQSVEYAEPISRRPSTIRRMEADALDQAERWQMLADLWPNAPIPQFHWPEDLPERIESLADVEMVAQRVRDAWNLGRAPITNLMDEMTKQGILVVVSQSPRVELFNRLLPRINEQPVVVTSVNESGYQQRITLARELGRLMINRRLADSINQKEARTRFALALLLPECRLRQALGGKRQNLEVQELDFLKHQYGLTMKACLHGAEERGIIKKGTNTKAISKRIDNTGEPNMPVQKENLFFTQKVYHALGEGIISEPKAAELLGKPAMTFHHERQITR